MASTMKDGDREVHVERKVIWNVVITRKWESSIDKDEWEHASEAEAIKTADRMVSKELANIRGEDKL